MTYKGYVVKDSFVIETVASNDIDEIIDWYLKKWSNYNILGSSIYHNRLVVYCNNCRMDNSELMLLIDKRLRLGKQEIYV